MIEKKPPERKISIDKVVIKTKLIEEEKCPTLKGYEFMQFDDDDLDLDE